MDLSKDKHVFIRLGFTDIKKRINGLSVFARTKAGRSEENKQNRLFDEAEEYASGKAPPVVLKGHVPVHDRVMRGRKPKLAATQHVEIVHDLEDGMERRSEYEFVPATHRSRFDTPAKPDTSTSL
jgi:hypothetical protein